MEFTRIIYEKRDGIAKITLNRPEKLNALDRKMNQEMEEAFADAESDDSVRVVVLTGAGRAFSTGADLKEARSLSHEQQVRDHVKWNRWTVNIENLNKPLIAAVNGLAVAFHLVLLADIIVADEDAEFQDTHANFGAPSRLFMTRLQRRVGPYKAMEIFFTCDRISAREAKEIGLVDKVVPKGKLTEAVDEMARKMAAKNPATLRIIKQSIKQGAPEDVGSFGPSRGEHRSCIRGCLSS